jgi:hypothetical protein
MDWVGKNRVLGCRQTIIKAIFQRLKENCMQLTGFSQ